MAEAGSVLGDSWEQEASPRYTSGAGVSGAAASEGWGKRKMALPGPAANSLESSEARQVRTVFPATDFGVPGWKRLLGDHSCATTQRNYCWQPRVLPNSLTAPLLPPPEQTRVG